MRKLRNEVLAATHDILNDQLEKFIKKLERLGGKVTIYTDGTYSKRGRDSPDCFVPILVRFPGRRKKVQYP